MVETAVQKLSSSSFFKSLSNNREKTYSLRIFLTNSGFDLTLLSMTDVGDKDGDQFEILMTNFAVLSDHGFDHGR